MTREQILLDLQQEYARRREENLRLFEQRQEAACSRCPGLRELLGERHQAVMQGVRASLLSKSRSAADFPLRMQTLNARIDALLAEAQLSPEVLKPVYTCPVCRDEGYVYDPSRRMCDCFRLEYNRRLLALSGIGEHSPTFDDFDETLFSDETDERGSSQRKAMSAIRNVCLTYADRFPDSPVQDLLLMGKSGLGKTFLLQCIARRVAEHGHLPVFVSAYRLFEAARSAHMENDSSYMAAYMNAPLLLIDDLGTEPLLGNVTLIQLFNLLNERQMAGRHTVISTNLSMSELQERYTERITSRFLDGTRCRRLLFIGEDIRRSLGKKAKKA